MASVKWLTRITLLSRPFEGFFQSERYVMPSRNGASEPLTRMFVKSLISQPATGRSTPRARIAWAVSHGRAKLPSPEWS